jgi:CubicO group peptidase (beta-lactamase class C family)
MTSADVRGGRYPRRDVLKMGAGSAGAVLLGGFGPGGMAQAAPGSAAADTLVSARPVYSGVWVPGGAGQYLRLDRTYEPFLADYGEMWNQSFRLRTLTSYVGTGDQVFYSAAYDPGSAGQYLRLGRNQDEFLAEFGELWNRDFRLGVLSAYVRDGQLVYDAAYNASSAGQGLRLHRTHDEFAATYAEMWNQNFRLTALVSYVLGGQVYFGGYFHPSTAGQYLRLSRTREDFLREYGELWDQNFRLAALSTHVWEGVVHYSATYNPGDGGNFIGLDRPHDDFLDTYGDMWNQNFRLATIVTDKVEALDVDRMAQGIRDRLGRVVTGFSATVASGSVRASAEGGWLRTASNPPAQRSSATARLNIASVNKPITAVAVLQLLAARGLDLDSTVERFLPRDWDPGPNVETITFRELLTHTSGIRNGTESYASLQATIEAGVQLADKTFLYRNANFALFRVIIPYMDGFRDRGVVDKDGATSERYLAYLNRRIFRPSGIATVRARPEDSEPGLCYPFPHANVGGTDFGDWTRLCGGGCLNMSADELATFLVQLRETSRLLTPAQVATMTENNLGWQGRARVRHGWVNDHGGFLWAPTPSAGNIELNAMVCSFSSGVHAAVLVNSPVGGGRNIRQAVIDAYHAAWRTL